MTTLKIRNGQAEYGTVHVMEEAMRAAEHGVFEVRRAKPVAEAQKSASKKKGGK